MPTSSAGPPAYQHPRWLVRRVAIGFAFLYVCGLLVANVFPRGNQEHGWPFVYMVRQDRVPGPLPNIFYGPWPLANPPIVQFWPTLLVLNCLCGLLLTVLATMVPVYWLRVRQRPVQFSLRSLFVLTTVVACLLALLRWCYGDRLKLWVAVDLWIEFSFLLVYYVVPACIVLTVAHWLVVRSGRSGRRSRWFGLHWLGWLAVLAVGGPFLHYSIFAAKFGTYGWPLNYTDFDRFSRQWRFDWPSLVVDLAVWLTVVASTAFVVERWIRRVELRVVLQKRAFVFLPLVVAITIWISNENWSREPAWYDYYPCLLGLAAAVCTFLLAPVEGIIVRHWKAIPKISLLAGVLAAAPVWFALGALSRAPVCSGLFAGGRSVFGDGRRCLLSTFDAS